MEKETLNQIVESHRQKLVALVGRFNQSEFQGTHEFAFLSLINSMNAQTEQLKKDLIPEEPK